jgi:hypothetical protein
LSFKKNLRKEMKLNNKTFQEILAEFFPKKKARKISRTWLGEGKVLEKCSMNNLSLNNSLFSHKSNFEPKRSCRLNLCSWAKQRISTMTMTSSDLILKNESKPTSPEPITLIKSCRLTVFRREDRSL